jgi:hypothetical protein
VSNDLTKVVPGHSALAKKADLIAWGDMLDTSRDRIQKLVDEGRLALDSPAAGAL